MPKPKPPATDLAEGKGNRNAAGPVSEPSPKALTSRAIRAFIPPPTREQLMAGSANLRRVYKVEA